jgi:salicylate 5-hydroxylase large subunit
MNVKQTISPNRIPYDIYTDPAIYEREQERIFRGSSWNYVGLSAEVPQPGDFRLTSIGDRAVVMVRDKDGGINVFENRCAHRGVAFCFEQSGNAKSFQCPYHQWTYDLRGELVGVPFRNGINGDGGMPADFRPADHPLNALNVAERNGTVFASFDPAMAPLAEYLGAEILEYFDRVFDGRQLRVLGYQRQRIECNWKLVLENIRDPYHATLLHVFLISFGLNRADQPGRVLIAKEGRHAVMTSQRREHVESEATREMSTLRAGLTLQGGEMLRPVREFPGDETLAMQALWPNVIVQQQSNTVATRRIVTRGPNACELHWTFFGYAGDDDAMTERRLMQANLMGPSGFVSVDDTEVMQQTQRGVGPSPRFEGFMEMDGSGQESTPYVITEAPLRAFHSYYRAVMGMD